MSAPSSPSIAESVTMTSFTQRIESYKSQNNLTSNQVDELLRDLMGALDTLQKEVDTTQNQASHYYDRMNQEAGAKRELEAILDDGRFVTVLIDGHDLPFQDYLLQGGFQGGVVAGESLRTNVQSIHWENPLHRTGDKIVIYIAVNARRLSEACVARSIVPDMERMYDFFAGLNQTHALTTLIDVGNQSELVCSKLKGLFELNYLDTHCKHIFFGGLCSYTTFIESFVGDEGFPQKVTLLLPHANSSNEPRPRIRTRTLDIFSSNSGISSPLLPTSGSQSPRARLQIDSVSESDNPFGRAYDEGRGIKRMRCDESPSRQPVRQHTYTRDAYTQEYNPEQPFLVLDPRPPQAAFINQFNQRLDYPVTYDRQYLRYLFMEKPKLCNNHYLRGFCAYGDTCRWDHSVNLSPLRINSLRQKARTSACCDPHCNDAECTLGHMCPRPRGQCRMDDCKFLPEQHNIAVDQVFEIDPVLMTRRKSSIIPFQKYSGPSEETQESTQGLGVYSQSNSPGVHHRSHKYSTDNGAMISDAYLNSLIADPGSANRSDGRKTASDYF